MDAKIYQISILYCIHLAGLAGFVQTNAIYIDPQYTGVKRGTIDQPFNSWTDLTWKDGYTYLFKCGSALDVSYKLRPTANNITIGAYGTGNRPLIRSSVSGDKVFDLGSLQDVVIRDLEVESTNNAITCFHFFNSVRGTLINCKIHGSEWGVRNVGSTGLFRIINCEIYKTGDDGCFTMNLDSIELVGSFIHDVNQKYFINKSEKFAGGDCFQMVNVKYFNIHENTLDHSATGNKFCIIANSNITGFLAHGNIEKNNLLRDKTGILIYLDQAENILIRYNRLENAEIAIYSHSINPQIFYNEFINLSGNVFMLGSKGTDTKILNNTFVNINTLINSYNEVVTIENNIFSNCCGTLFIGGENIKLNYNCYNEVNKIGARNIGSNSIQTDPMFNDPSKMDFRLKKNSPCLHKGNKRWNIYHDIDGNSISNDTPVDLGAHQFSSDTSGHPTGTIIYQRYYIARNNGLSVPFFERTTGLLKDDYNNI